MAERENWKWTILSWGPLEPSTKLTHKYNYTDRLCIILIANREAGGDDGKINFNTFEVSVGILCPPPSMVMHILCKFIKWNEKQQRLSATTATQILSGEKLPSESCICIRRTVDRYLYTKVHLCDNINVKRPIAYNPSLNQSTNGAIICDDDKTENENNNAENSKSISNKTKKHRKKLVKRKCFGSKDISIYGFSFHSIAQVSKIQIITKGFPIQKCILKQHGTHARLRRRFWRICLH